MKKIFTSICLLCVIMNIFAFSLEDKYQQLILEGMQLFQNGEFNKSIPLFLEADEIYETGEITDEPNLASLGLIYCFSLGNDGENTLKYGNKYRKSIHSSSFEVDDLYLETLYQLADLNYNYGNYDDLLDIAHEIIDVSEGLFGKNNKEYANSLIFLSKSYKTIDNYDLSLEYALQAKELIEHIFGDETEEFFIVLSQLAVCYSDIGQFQKALDLEQSSYNFFKTKYGEEHEYALANLNNIALDFKNIGEYKKALDIDLEILKQIENSSQMVTPDYIRALTNVASDFSRLGNFYEAIAYCERALQIQKTSASINHPDYLRLLNNLATYKTSSGDNAEALRLLHFISQKWEDTYPDSPFLATSYNNLALAYYNIGDYENALKYGERSFAIRENKLGLKHPDFLNSVSNLALFNDAIGNTDKAILLISENLDNIREVFGYNSAIYALALNNLSSYKFSKGEMDEGINLLIEAGTINQNVLGPEHPSVILDGFKLADVLHEMGELKHAIEVNRISLLALTEIIDIYHPNCITGLCNLTRYYFEDGDEENLKSSCLLANELNSQMITHSFSYMTKEDRNKFWGLNQFWYKNSLPRFIYSYYSSNLAVVAFNGCLFSKGIILNTQIELDNIIGKSGNEEVINKYNSLLSLKKQISHISEHGKKNLSNDTDSLERIANDIERELMYEIKEFGDYTRNLSITWEDVRDNLKEKDAAIEFVHFPLNNDSTMYMAYALRPNIDAPELIKLFEEKDLTSLIDEDDKASIYTNKSASELIWGKLRPQLEGVENVYFAPDGVLHQIAIEYLPNIDGEGMISDKFNLHRLSSTREIALNQHNALTKKAVVYGGIKYDTDVSTMEIESRKYDRPKHRGFSTYYNLGDSLALRGSLEYLDGSLTEAENINGMMKENNYNSTFLSGNDATEESFKSLSGKANGIIHISTHGFYWTESEAERKASLNDRLMFMSQLGDNARRNVEDKALTRTGLFMAGAKNALGGVELPEDVDDGILTAQEIANLDLRGLDLVVLSACQTGMGDISGDGVFGLQRGFKKAGANTILMSLWEVSDDATQILMTNFYKNYLGGMSKQQALREAQKAVRETPGFSDPEYWAAFILLDALN